MMKKKTDMNDGLVYVRLIGTNSEDEYEYDFYFSENPDEVEGEGWYDEIAGLSSNMEPYEGTYTSIERVHTKVPFSCAQDNRILSMRHVVCGVLALAWEDISEYNMYPEPFRFVFHFGDRYCDVFKKFNEREIVT